MTLEGRSLPRSDEAETSVLGAMMMDHVAADIAAEELAAEDFFHLTHRLIFRAITKLRDEGHDIDAIAVREEMRRRGEYEAVGDDYMAGLVESTPTAANVRYHCRIVAEQAVRRRLINAGTDIVELAYDTPEVDDLLDLAERTVFGVTQSSGAAKGDGLLASSVVVRETMDMILSGTSRRIPTGFHALDSMCGGFGPGELIILAARPSMGKSALGFQIASNVALGLEKPVAIFSLEMDRRQTMCRFLSVGAEIHLDALARGDAARLTTEDLERLEAAAKKLQASPVYIDDDGLLSIHDLRARARRHKAQHDIQMVVVDYLQLMEGSAGRDANRTQQVGSISRGLKQLAKELEIPVLCLAQLNRSVDSRENKRPRLSDLRDSGEIEQDADIVMFLYRPEYYNPDMAAGLDKPSMTEVIFAKQRQGPIGRAQLTFVPTLAQFTDHAPSWEHEW